MKKNDPEIRQNFEELLKKKMAELSDSVDCFDKISARAFPEKDSDFSDCGSTVSDLENVTGKRRMRLPVLRWTAAAAALIICLSIVPVGVLFNKMKTTSQASLKRSFSRI